MVHFSSFQNNIVNRKKILISCCRDIDCIQMIQNNPQCMMRILIFSTITGPLLYCKFFSRNILNTNRALLKMISTIKIQKTPRSGPGQSLTLTGYSSLFLKIT